MVIIIITQSGRILYFKTLLSSGMPCVVIMQLRIKALYGKVISMLVTLFWVMEVVAVLGLGIASLVAIDGQ